MNMEKRDFYVVITKDEDGCLVGEVTQIKSCFNQGETVDELMENMRETIQVCLEEFGVRDQSEFIEVLTTIVPTDSTGSLQREFHVVITRDGTGCFRGVAPQLRECFEEGQSKSELMQNMRKAIELGLEYDDLEDCSKFLEVRKVEI